MATKGRPGRDVENGLWSALQTRLQGVDGTTLAIKPEIMLHGVILLSRKGCGIQLPLPVVRGKGAPVSSTEPLLRCPQRPRKDAVGAADG
ncbi:hypothetical protein CO674_31675 [Rhizobium hidalgonense]|uniref:Transposase n=1 Tax=Rhizobium hidalgonense TaxID=1538159 RepID=A0ABX4JKX9_9HYPH|nr:hypothetical protein CO674_31675 [Rhizobium hidalgonense]